LTKPGERVIFIIVMRRRTVVPAILAAFFLLAAATPQERPAKKPKWDYMSNFLSRNTAPLGLKENPLLKKMLRQSRTKWAIRSGFRHILD
jgi:hypothetical protein